MAPTEDAAKASLRDGRGDSGCVHRRDIPGLGDPPIQRMLAQAMGPERAYELRAHGNGWPWQHSIFEGCADAEADRNPRRAPELR